MLRRAVKVRDHEVASLSRTSYFTKKELTALVKEFSEGNTKRKWPLEDVVSILKRFFPHGKDVTAWADVVLRVVDFDHNGSISFEDISVFLSRATKGTESEEAEVLFRALARNDDVSQLEGSVLASRLSALESMGAPPLEVNESEDNRSGRVNECLGSIGQCEFSPYLEDFVVTFSKDARLRSLLKTFIVNPLLAQLNMHSYGEAFGPISFDGGTLLEDPSPHSKTEVRTSAQLFSSAPAPPVPNLQSSTTSSPFSSSSSSSSINRRPGARATPLERTAGVFTTLRVFVSSTFVDMHGERDALIRTVFPELNARAAALWIRLVPVDLRWGVTSEMVTDIQRLCCDEISRCVGPEGGSPWVIALRGQRVGWIPPELDSPSLFAEARHVAEWMASAPSPLSITDVEVTHGILSRPSASSSSSSTSGGSSVVPHAFVYTRDPSFLAATPSEFRPLFECEYTASDPPESPLMTHRSDASAAEAVHESVTASLHRVPNVIAREYEATFDRVVWTSSGGGGVRRTAAAYVKGLEALCERMIEDVWSSLVKEYPPLPPLTNALEVEDLAHRAGVKERARAVVGRSDTLAVLRGYALSATGASEGSSSQGSGRSRSGATESSKRSSTPLVVLGGPGTGKSALMAAFAEGMEREGAVNVITHLVGATASSTDLRSMLHRLCHRLSEVAGSSRALPLELPLLVRSFAGLLVEAGSVAPTLIVIDAVNQLSESGGAHGLVWLPLLLPPGTAIVLSTVVHDTNVLGSLRARTGSVAVREVSLAPLARSERRDLLVTTLARSNKVLEESQLEALLNKTHGDVPLYLVAAAEELRVFGVYEKLSEYIGSLPDTVSTLFAAALTRLEGDHGAELVRQALSCLLVSRGGLLQTELMEILDCVVVTERRKSNFARLRGALEAFLTPTGGGLVTFFHQQLAIAARVRYFPPYNKALLGTVDYYSMYHTLLADYFENEKANPRRERDSSSRSKKLGAKLWDGSYERAFSELPYHLIEGGQWTRLETLLQDLAFLSRKCQLCGIGAVVDDYMRVQAVAERAPRTFNHENLNALCRHFVSKAAVLQRFPSLLFQVTANASDSSLPGQIAAGARVRPPSWLCALNKTQGSDPCLLSLTVHTDYVVDVAFSPDATSVLSASFDGTLRVFDALKGEERHCLRGHTDAVLGLAVAWCDNLVASAGKDNVVGLWNYRTGVSVARLVGHTNHVNVVAWTAPPDRYSRGGPLRLVSGSRDRTARVWAEASPSSGTAKSLEWLTVSEAVGHTDDVLGAAFWPAFVEVLVTASGDKTLKVWDVSMMSASLLHTLEGHTDDVNSVAFSSTGARLASCSDDCTIRIWDGGLGPAVAPALLAVLKVHSENVMSVRFTVDDKAVVSASYDGTVRVTNIMTGLEVRSFSGHSAYVNAVAVSKDGSRIASASDDMSVKVWDMEAQFTSSVVHGGPVLALAHTATSNTSFTPCYETRLVLTGSADGTAALVNAGSGALIRRLVGHTGPVSDVSMSANLSCCLTGSHDTTLRTWDVASGLPIAVLSGHSARVSAVALTDNGGLAASASWDKTVALWSLSGFHGNGEVTHQSPSVVLSSRHSSYPNAVALWGGSDLASPSLLAVSGSDSEILTQSPSGFVLRYQSGGEVNVVRIGVLLPVSSSPLVVYGCDRDVVVRDLRDPQGAPVTRFVEHADNVSDAQLALEGYSLVSVAGRELLVWDVRKTSSPLNRHMADFPLGCVASFGTTFLEVVVGDSGGRVHVLRREVDLDTEER